MAGGGLRPSVAARLPSRPLPRHPEPSEGGVSAPLAAQGSYGSLELWNEKEVNSIFPTIIICLHVITWSNERFIFKENYQIIVISVDKFN